MNIKPKYRCIINVWPRSQVFDKITKYERHIIEQMQLKYGNFIEFSDISEIYEQFDDVDPKNLRIVTHGATSKLKRHKYLYDKASGDILCALDEDFPLDFKNLVLSHSKMEQLRVNPHIIIKFSQQWENR